MAMGVAGMIIDSDDWDHSLIPCEAPVRWINLTKYQIIINHH